MGGVGGKGWKAQEFSCRPVTLDVSCRQCDRQVALCMGALCTWMVFKPTRQKHILETVSVGRGPRTSPGQWMKRREDETAWRPGKEGRGRGEWSWSPRVEMALEEGGYQLDPVLPGVMKWEAQPDSCLEPREGHCSLDESNLGGTEVGEPDWVGSKNNRKQLGMRKKLWKWMKVMVPEQCECS